MKSARNPKATDAQSRPHYSEIDRARDALYAIPPDTARDEWIRAGMAAKAAGLDFDTFNDWSATAGNYDPSDAKSAWRSFDPDGGIGAGTLYDMAKAHGWQSSARAPVRRPVERKPEPAPKPDVAALWGRCKPATSHPYIEAKQGRPDGLGIVPDDEPLTIRGQSVAGWLAVPAYADGALQSLQFIPAQGDKLNMKGAPMAGASFTVGALDTAGPVYLCEGIGQAWACNQAAGRPAVVCFGWGNVKLIAEKLVDYSLVLVPDRGKEHDAEAIARDTGASVVTMPDDRPDNFDANDYKQAEGEHALADLLGQATAPAYPAPDPLPAALPDVEPFAPELLPSSLADRCADIAERMQCAPEFPAIGSMVALGSVIGRAVGIRPKQRDDWLVVPNLWGCIVGRPSVLKSPALGDAMTPLGRLEAEAGEAYQQAKQAHDTAETLAGLEQKEAEKQAKAALKKGNRDEAERILTTAGDEPEPPTQRRFKTNDATVEKLGELLADSPRGVLMFRDELAGWLANLEKEGREGDRSFYLEAFNGSGSFTYDRIGRGTVHIDACTVSVLGGTQPGKLAQYVRHAIKGGAGDDGLIQRFQMMAWPDNGAWRHVDRWPDNEAKQRAHDIFQHLADITGEQVGAVTGQFDDIPALGFDEAGQAVFDDWYTTLMQRIRADDLPAYLEAHLAKYASLMPSLALVIHLAEYGTGPVPESAAMRAAAWCEYLESHARRMYAPGLMGDELAARELARKIKAGKIGPQFTPRELYRKGWANLSTPDDADGALSVLEEYGWLFITENRPTGGGRPTTTCVVNPRISEVTL